MWFLPLFQSLCQQSGFAYNIRFHDRFLAAPVADKLSNGLMNSSLQTNVRNNNHVTAWKGPLKGTQRDRAAQPLRQGWEYEVLPNSFVPWSCPGGGSEGANLSIILMEGFSFEMQGHVGGHARGSCKEGHSCESKLLHNCCFFVPSQLLSSFLPYFSLLSYLLW